MQPTYTDDERERAQRMAAELRATMGLAPATVRVEVQLFDLFRVIGALQLAWRHPGLSHEIRSAIEGFAAQLEGAFDADAMPETARMLEQGWHQEFDRR